MPYLRFDEWVKSRGPNGIVEFRDFFRGVAQARYVLRRIVRIVDEQAKGAGLEPLEHQALLQIYGSEGERLRMRDVADRLDVPAAVASRLVSGLEDKGLVVREKSDGDRRVTEALITDEGRDRCVAIWETVEYEVEYFRRQLTDEERRLALAIFAFYVGFAVAIEPVEEPLWGA